MNIVERPRFGIFTLFVTNNLSYGKGKTFPLFF
jgi:hypothetical protein